MRKKLTIFIVAVSFLTLCNVILYTRRVRTTEDEKRIMTDEWSYNSLSFNNNNNFNNSLPMSGIKMLAMKVTNVTTMQMSTTTTTPELESPSASVIMTSINISSWSPFSPQNIAATLTNRTYIINGTSLVVEVMKPRKITLNITFNVATMMLDDSIFNNNFNESYLNSSTLLSTLSTNDNGIDFNANFTGNSSIDIINDVTTAKVIEIPSANTTLTLPKSPYPEHPFLMMINVDDLCGVANITLLILVTTAVNHYDNRQAIRETWGGFAKDQPDVRLAFVMGKPQNQKSDEPRIVREALDHADVLQEDFLDTYKNLSLKTLMLLKWSQTHCPNAKFVMKTDDDMFVNIPNLLRYLRGLRYNRSLLLGRLVRGARPERSVTSKYYVPNSVYKEKVYPDYLSGTAYVMSMDVVTKLYTTSMTTPVFFFEDVYVTGICAKKARIVRRNHAGFVFYKRPVKGCAYIRAITGHNNSPNDLRKIWRELQRKSLKC